MEKGSAVERDPACNCPQAYGGPVVWRALGGACSLILALTVAAGCSESPVDAPDSGEELLAPEAAAMSQGQGSGKGNVRGQGVSFTPQPGEKKSMVIRFQAGDGEPVVGCDIHYVVPRTRREGHIHVFPNQVFFFHAVDAPVEKVRVLREHAGAGNYKFESPGDDAGTWRAELWFDGAANDNLLSGSFFWSGEVENVNDPDDVRIGTCEGTLTGVPFENFFGVANFSVTPSP